MMQQHTFDYIAGEGSGCASLRSLKDHSAAKEDSGRSAFGWIRFLCPFDCVR